MAGDCPAYRINVARGDAERPASLMFPAAVAVVDAELGILLRLTSYLGGKPVRRGELTDISAAAGDFSVNLPPGLPVSEESGPSGQSGSSQPASIALQAASILARQAATETAKAPGHPAPRRPGLTAYRPVFHLVRGGAAGLILVVCVRCCARCWSGGTRRPAICRLP